ncbi:DUF4394 domain-containing protein [Hymenobacter sp. PAMC 26628]|uniref:DUF4394 domain-containing protein n=1 Tax=Hymenobacter sp. PAMC 26628 TaxID=1484118 RepID=UPI0007705EE7|nr:DUF4394 domain-containing protein [Hymenobacter sp. PAMC 26628]AMJ65620.1 hypothetical protein AXW84_09395 [Hymenobacter sp. PAMC 26628]
MKAFVPFSPAHSFSGRPWLATLGLGLGLLAATPALAQTPTIYGLGTLSHDVASGNPLFQAGAPAGAQGIISIDPATGGPMQYGSPQRVATLITGVNVGQVLVGMDYRPNTGVLYALGYDASQTTGNAQLYTLDPLSGVATAVGTASSLNLGTRVTRIGFDFNPTVDRIRVEGGTTGANYRLDPNNGAIVLQDGNLNYAALSATPIVGAVAYTNSYIGSTSTALYALDAPGNGTGLSDNSVANNGLLSLQTPPNNGTLTTGQMVKLGTNPFGDPAAVGVDVYYNANANTNQAYLTEVTSPNGSGLSSSNFYSLDLATGAAIKLGNTAPASSFTPFDVRDIAVAIAAPTQPALVGQLLYAVAGGNLISFDSGAPGTIRSAVNFGGGLTAGEAVVGVDFRPATGQLYALGYNAAAGTGTVYAVNLTTGALTAAGAAIPLALGAATDRVGFDFNPTVDRIRVVATNGNNYRLNPNDGALVLQDGNLTAGTVISAAAYTNSSSAANSTALYDYDAVAGQLYLQSPPNNGTLVAVGGAGGPTSADGADFDIFNTRGTTTNAAFLAVAPGGVAGSPNYDNLYTVDLTAGTTASAGRIGLGSNVSGLTAFIAVGTALTWNGSASTDWGTAANWTPNRVPTSVDDVTIPSGTPNQPAVSGSQAARYVVLASGASLTSNDGSTLTVGGNFTNNGGTLAGTGSGTIALAGTAAQVIGGTGTSAFQNLTVGTAPVSLAGPAAVQRVLLLNGDLTTTGQSLTLLSNAANSAHVVNAAGAVTGPVTVQRYIDGSINSGAGYRHYAAPVTGSTVADLATGGFTPVVNPAYNSAPIPSQVRAFPTVFGFDETRINTSGNPTPQDFDKGFFSPGALSDALTPGQGYVVNIPASETVDFVGTLNNGDVARTGLTCGGQTESGWQLLGNPYPSPISWTTTYNDGAAGLNNAVYVVKSTGQYAGGYASYVNGVGVNGGTDQIATGQGFFVRVAAAGTPGALTFKNSGRLTTYASPAFQRGNATTAPLVRLALRNAAGRADEAVVYFDAAATAGFDAALDAYKLNPAGATMALATAGAEPLSIDARPALGTADVLVPLSVQAEAGSYSLAAAELLRLPAGTKAFLRDALTGSVTDLAQQPSYPFAVVAGASATGRFSLLLTTQAVLATAPAALSKQVNVFPNPARGTVSVGLPASLSRQNIDATLVNALGQTVLRATLPAGATSQLALPSVARGVYTLRLLTAEGTVSKRLIVE